MLTDLIKKPIKVCFIILKSYPLFNQNIKSRFGGAEIDLYFIATELAKDQNFEVSFVVGDYGQGPVEICENVKVIKSVNVDKNLFLGSWRIWRALYNADADIYFGKAFSLNTFLQALFCKIHKRKYIYRTAHTNECDGTYLKNFPFRGKAILWAIHTAKKVIVQNHADAENLFKTTEIHSEVIRNGHRLNDMPQKSRNTILWVGRSAQFKQPELFIGLACNMPAQNFTMICQKASNGINYDNLIERAKVPDNLNFIQRVPFNQIDDYFQKAKIFINTSDSEGFPNTFIQACKSSVPILSLNVNPDGFLDKYNCGISCDGDWDKLVDSLKFMLAEERYIELGRNARKYAEEHHDIIKIAKQYKKLLIQLAQDKAGSA